MHVVHKVHVVHKGDLATTHFGLTWYSLRGKMQ